MNDELLLFNPLNINKMKKLFYFFALMLTTVGFTACGDDDDEKAPIIVSFSQAQYSLGGQIGDKVVITANASAPFEKATTVTLGFNSINFSVRETL